MSRFEEESQPGPALEGETEPRLLTRPDAPEAPRRRITLRHHAQHASERGGLAAWARRLAARRPQEPTPAPVHHHRRRFFLWIVAVSLVLLVVSALVMVLDLRHALRASLPQLDGDIHIAGLTAPVAVTRNAEGVPSIHAANVSDLLFAEGYITAADRLWQMDGLRRHAAGELAEVLGPGLVEHDRRQRYLQLRAAADRATAALPPAQLAQLEAYARGVNAFIDTHPKSLPVEFRLLAYKPAPWSPRDSLLVSLAMFQDLSTQFPQKLNREALSAHLPADLLPDLYPVGSWRDQPPANQGRNLTTPHEVEQIPLDPSQSRLDAPPVTPDPAPLLALTAAFGGQNRCDGCRAGSNNWAVSGTHTASGSPLLSNDMHLNLAIPDIWYEASLHSAGSGSDGLDVTGFTLPGVPFVIVGRNAHVAWGVTNLGADVQDLLVEHLRGTGANTEYERPDGSWTLVHHQPERIHVRGGRDVVLDVLTTSHAVGSTAIETPIISPLLRLEGRDLALAWTAYDPANVTSPFLSVDQATDGSALTAAFASFGGPTLNLVWADDGNHIGYHAIGRIPIRGPAVQHPKAIPTANPEAPAPQGTPLPADGDDEGGAPDGPQAGLTSQPAPGPHLVLSAFHPVRRRPRAQASARTRARATRRSAPARRALPVTTVQPEAVIPTAAPINYTVGSPISPLPVDALDAAQAWSGYIGYADMPNVSNPANGILATANARITPDDYPYAVANDWSDAFRTARILHLLSNRNGLTPADMLRMQNDVHSDVNRAEAQRFAYAVDHASPKALGKDARQLHQAADLLRRWDGGMAASSPAAAVFTAAHDLLWPSLLVPQILAHDGPNTSAREANSLVLLYTWGERNSAAELILQNQPARWLPHGFTTWSDLLTSVLARGLAAGHAPGDLSRWSYGQLHTVEIAHPIFGDHALLSAALGIQGTTGPRPAPGDATTIKQIGAHFGPSERFTADLSSPDLTFANITTGESGDGLSPWYLDQFAPWFNGTTFALPLHTDAPTHTLHLLPQ